MKQLLNVLLLSMFVLITGCKVNDPDFIVDEGAIKGKVVDRYSGQPIPLAVVKTIPETETKLTDSTGNFVFGHIKSRGYTVIAQCDSFHTDSADVIVETNKTTEVLLGLRSINSVSRYKTPPPPGKLPYPLHDPEFSQQSYNKMVNELFIINNFGQDQFTYIHDGLDFVAPNGTKIFAIDSGYVKAIIGSEPYYKTLIIEDKKSPGYAWGYTHVNFFAVKEGDFVEQGTYLAKINFQGVDHTHLSRFKLKSGGTWSNFNDLLSIQPDNYFYYHDSKRPSIKKPFYYFQNNSNTRFLNDGVIKIQGDVDIVAGIREIGEYARGNIPGGSGSTIGDRLAVSKILYAIEAPDGMVYNLNSFDFSKIIYSSKDALSSTNLIYKDYTIIEGKERTGMEWSDYYSYYIITNYKYKEETGLLDLKNATLAWNTNEKNDDGTSRFPNGKYKVTVTAFDFSGNSVVENDFVEVNN